MITTDQIPGIPMGVCRPTNGRLGWKPWKVLDCEIPIVRMVDHSFVDAVKAFEAINTQGVRQALQR
jgi:hypothetical protein